MGAENILLNRVVGKMTLVVAIRRVRKPGIKFDIMIIFEGAQGSGKSTATFSQGNFLDQALLGIDEKAQMEALEDIWFYRVADVASRNL